MIRFRASPPGKLPRPCVCVDDATRRCEMRVGDASINGTPLQTIFIGFSSSYLWSGTLCLQACQRLRKLGTRECIYLKERLVVCPIPFSFLDTHLFTLAPVQASEKAIKTFQTRVSVGFYLLYCTSQIPRMFSYFQGENQILKPSYQKCT